MNDEFMKYIEGMDGEFIKKAMTHLDEKYPFVSAEKESENQKWFSEWLEEKRIKKYLF